jgi:O-antigen ligase
LVKNKTNMGRRINLFFKKNSLYLIFLFTAALYPFSINIKGDGVSANYIYILFPLLFLMRNRGKIYLPNNIFAGYILIFSAIFFIALIYQLSYIQYLERRIISFLIFMSIFSLIFIKIDDRMIASFKVSLILISLILSFKSIFLYFSLGGYELGFAAKDLVGSQRIGFIYIVAVWLLFFYKSLGWKSNSIKYFFLVILIMGILLTFSRSSIIALIGSFSLYLIYKLKNRTKQSYKLRIRILINMFFILFITLGVGLFLIDHIAEIINFYVSRLFVLKAPDGENFWQLGDPESSEGYRVFMLGKILEFVANNPFTGSGFLGVWIMFDDGSGSSHNQFTDVLFRTGIFGFIAYCALLYQLLAFLMRKAPEFFWGMLGVVIYGFMHETFKESQGGFLLAFLIGMFSSWIRDHYVLQRGS